MQKLFSPISINMYSQPTYFDDIIPKDQHKDISEWCLDVKWYAGILKMNYSGDNEFSLTHRIWDISVLVEVLNQVGFEVKLYKRNTFLKLSEDDYKITFACRRIK